MPATATADAKCRGRFGDMQRLVTMAKVEARERPSHASTSTSILPHAAVHYRLPLLSISVATPCGPKELLDGSLATYLWGCSPCKAHKIRNMKPEPIPWNDFDSVPVRLNKESWDFAYGAIWKLEFDRGDGVDGEADDDCHSFGRLIEDPCKWLKV